jgi:hypothetical protein
MKKSGFQNKNKILVILFFLLIACDGIFVPDPIDPRLPKYTEEGNDVAGAFINNRIWESIVSFNFLNVYNAPLIAAWQENDSLLIRFNGNTDGEISSIEFHLKGLKISELKDLTTLEGQKIQLDGTKNSGFYIQNYTPFSYDNKGVGQIYFKHVSVRDSNDSVEGQASKTLIISGTFGFSMNDSMGNTIKVFSGRFDYQITENNFLSEYNNGTP